MYLHYQGQNTILARVWTLTLHETSNKEVLCAFQKQINLLGCITLLQKNVDMKSNGIRFCLEVGIVLISLTKNIHLEALTL